MGGQVGDKGYIENSGNKTTVIDTRKENELTLHIVKQLPENLDKPFKMVVDKKKRLATEANHTATHLLHHALRKVLGTHVEQKGSYVNEEKLRFDFSHPSKLTDEEIRQVERIVNAAIRADYSLEDFRNIPIAEAKEMGAMALFGEKYGDKVRCVRFGESIELCGGTHASSTGRIGMLNIMSETAVAAGVRRIEAVTGEVCEEYFNNVADTIKEIRSFFVASPNIVQSIKKLIEEDAELRAKLEKMQKEKALQLADSLKAKIENISGVDYLETDCSDLGADMVKDMAFKFKSEYPRICFVAYGVQDGKVNLTLMLGDQLVAEGKDASKIIRQAAKNIKGGGGGQKHFATAGGKDASGIAKAVEEIKQQVIS